MFIERFLAALGRLWREPLSDPLGRLPAPEQIRKALARERARCDRSGGCLSVVTFTPSGPDHGSADLRCLAEVLPGQLRSTDEFGWLDDYQLCAVLPDTTPEGARVVIDRVRQDLPAEAALVYEVHAYPNPGAAPPSDARPAPEQPSAEPLETLLLGPLPAWKRALDVAGAVAGLTLLSPLLLAVAAAVKLTSPGPVLFRQRRSGRGGRPFVMLKFRTMVADAEAQKAGLLAHNEQDGPAFKMKRDPRVTLVGRFLRKSSLDELPQLWNVLRGEMSLVGPRPLPCDETDACAAWQRRRLDVLPGLTCIWQVRGRCNVSFVEWMRMDLRYVHSQSLWHDVRLLLETVPAVVLRRGAH